MLVSALPVPFGDAGRQRQYEAMLAALGAEDEAGAAAPATVLLGNPGAFSPIAVDVLIVRPAALALVVLTPHAGHLTIAALAHGTWQLDGQPLLDFAGANNPFAQYQQQLPLALRWLSEHLGLPEEELPPCTGIALFDAPLTFGSEVEAQLHRHAAAHDFQLVGGAAQLPARLRQPLAAQLVALDADELLDWGYFLANDPYAAHKQGGPESPFEGLPAYLTHKLRQLWRWLGAEDILADPPYGGPPPDHHLRDQQAQARLHQLRQELQAGLHQQRQEAAAREALRTQELALLRQQLAQSSPSATEREAEQRAKAALEESLRTARAELATRNHELDARIQQLGQLIGQLQTAPSGLAPAAPAATGVPANGRLPSALAPPLAPPATAKKPRPIAAPAWSFRRLRQAERWGLVLLAVASVGVGTWSVVRWAQHPAPHPAATVAQRALPEEGFEETQPADQDELADSLANTQTAATDTLTTRATEPTMTSTEPEPASTDKEAITSETPAPEATPVSTETTAPVVPATPEAAPTASPDPTESEPSPNP